MEVLVEQISKVETAELGGQEFQLAVLSALLQVRDFLIPPESWWSTDILSSLPGKD